MEVGQVVKGKVTEVLKFGANVELENGEKGFIHISKISNQYVQKVEDFLKVGQEVEAKIVGKGKDGKWELSLKEETTKMSDAELKKEEFEKKLQKFLKDSQKTYSEYKKRLDKKQGVTKRR
ncbi:S1 RNA binding domain protein [Fervidobacterium changbaicum]|uniref:S1 RNA-binding domain-containing protein n=2 Tax=Fervidobacterium TaxID=2422 RepID=A0AAI8CKZ6_FERIS|nr:MULTISPECIES: S1 RNA-binding domain-containing protein [Fervidobacterium]AMW32260.1 S1 RNA-binding domain-containing protein [Fervidobacterium islandicum]QAV32400.1 RNA-binding protein [Fervidobacterium changbaicum]SDH18217.1 S1 RNA binding domain protein [Fervidobacterium changbaicum]